ncbi:tetratricopeptide repeat protein [Francisella hispaniensis]|uniref:TPR repeat, SEL1 subfamily n=1 Tax=Francisella hispaniensis TaxID=622488 RepID=F4BHK9_9GAMM|nr:tetratricopeptide repeat protein [Francisella hispaniensis]AEE26953.1 TPR repeat, SEL1 subfamily [Francisella hispaniensis]
MRKVPLILSFLLPLYTYSNIITIKDTYEQAECRKEIRQQNFQEAFQKCLSLARQGDSVGEFFTALLYINGQGVQKSEKEAFEYFQKSAIKGNADAIGQLGVMYINGEYVKKDEFKGIQLIRYSNDMKKNPINTKILDAYEKYLAIQKEKSIGKVTVYITISKKTCSEIGGKYQQGYTFPGEKWPNMCTDKDGNVLSTIYQALYYKDNSNFIMKTLFSKNN